ncbi:GIY-YIG nuclease family protein [Streptomyces sp. ME03-5709C]|nr:GIY-YIG nuclease family protein [Streptomyces sp. ME03-5709C]
MPKNTTTLREGSAPAKDQLPNDLALSMSATIQHIRLIQAKEARLADVRRETLGQLLHRIGSDYRTGNLTDEQLCAAFEEVSSHKIPGLLCAWGKAIGVPWQRISHMRKNLPNGPEGSWVGEYPIPHDAPRPLSGVAVVYVLFDEVNEPCYVGSTDKFSARVAAHVKDGKRFVRWHAHPCRDREHAYELENRLLKRHMPRLNKKAGR